MQEAEKQTFQRLQDAGMRPHRVRLPLPAQFRRQRAAEEVADRADHLFAALTVPDDPRFAQTGIAGEIEFETQRFERLFGGIGKTVFDARRQDGDRPGGDRPTAVRQQERRRAVERDLDLKVVVRMQATGSFRFRKDPVAVQFEPQFPGTHGCNS